MFGEITNIFPDKVLIVKIISCFFNNAGKPKKMLNVSPNTIFGAVVRQNLHITVCEKVCGQTISILNKSEINQVSECFLILHISQIYFYF